MLSCGRRKRSGTGVKDSAPCDCWKPNRPSEPKERKENNNNGGGEKKGKEFFWEGGREAILEFFWVTGKGESKHQPAVGAPQGGERGRKGAETTGGKGKYF